MTAQTDSIARFARHFLTREQDRMTTYAEELQDERHAAMQKFNQGNDLSLDAQPVHRDPEAVVVYSEAGDQPELIAQFDDTADFERWASSLGRMYEDEAFETIERMAEAQRERAQREAFATYVHTPRHRAPVTDLRDLFETLSERSAA